MSSKLPDAAQKEYLVQHEIPLMMNDLIAKLAEEKPANPYTFLKTIIEKAELESIVRKKHSVASGSADIAVIGLAVMGQNLILNIADKKFNVVAFNRTVEKVDEFIKGEGKHEHIFGATSIEDMCSKLRKPRRVMLLVRAGEAVDEFIRQLIPFLDEGDIIIDGGNSHFPDTIRRYNYLAQIGIHYVGAGVSGGEEGARNGPSLMPGGSLEAWPHLKPIFQGICAKAEGSNEPCCDWVGPGGSGHYVKMVHNGIEYGDMQLIAETYHIMRDCLCMSNVQMAEVFKQWNKTELDSFLIKITSDIVDYRAEDGEGFLVERIKDSAGQKGTGKWTAVDALDIGIPLTLIGEAVFARCLSSLKGEREKASKVLRGPAQKMFQGNQEELLEDLRKALYASKIVSYAQGYMMLRQAAVEHKWTELNYGGIALMWRGGCIIRSRFLGKIKEAFDRNPQLENLLVDDYFTEVMNSCHESWRRVIVAATTHGVPVPALSSALSFYDGYRAERLPANLIQAQRDYFGAHTYELLGQPGKMHHTNWTGTGGKVSSTAYHA